MKTTWIIAGALMGSFAICGSAQTNSSAPDFTLPPMHLRTELTLNSPDSSGPSPFPAHALNTEIPEREVSASTGDTAGALESYATRSDRFYLVPGAEPGPDSQFGQALDAIAGPDVVHLGKVSLSSSVITAVKRKNPLCLLNATVLKMTW